MNPISYILHITMSMLFISNLHVQCSTNIHLYQYVLKRLKSYYLLDKGGGPIGPKDQGIYILLYNKFFNSGESIYTTPKSCGPWGGINI